MRTTCRHCHTPLPAPSAKGGRPRAICGRTVCRLADGQRRKARVQSRRLLTWAEKRGDAALADRCRRRLETLA